MTALELSERLNRLRSTINSGNEELKNFFEASTQRRVSKRAGSILIVDDEVDQHEIIKKNILWKDKSLSVLSAYTAEEARRFLASEEIKVVILDIRLPKTELDPAMDESGEELAEWIKSRYGDLPVIFHTGYPSVGKRVSDAYPGARFLVKGGSDISELLCMIA